MLNLKHRFYLHEKNYSKNIFFMFTLSVTVVLFLFSDNLIHEQYVFALNSIGEVVIRPSPPVIISITASDPNNVAGYSNGDTMTVRFSEPTNMPSVVTKSNIDDLFTYSQSGSPVILGSAYAGTWTSPSTLVITLTNVAGASPTPAVGGLTLQVKTGAHLKTSSGTSLDSSSTSPPLIGSFGSSAGPFITDVIADAPNNISGYSNGDTITVRFSEPTNMPGGTSTQNKIFVDNLFDFSQSLGSDYSGKWVNPLIFKITIIDKTGGNPTFGDSGGLYLTLKASGNLKNSAETSSVSTSMSSTLSGNFGTFSATTLVGNGSSSIVTLPSGIVSQVKLPSDTNGTVTIQRAADATNNSASGGGTIQFIGEVVDITPGDGASCHSGCDISFTFTRNDLPVGTSPADVKVLHDANNDGKFDGLGEQLNTIIIEGPTGVFTATAQSFFNSNFGMGIVTSSPSPSNVGGSTGSDGGYSGSAPSFSSVTLNSVTPSETTSQFIGVQVSGLYPTQNPTKIISIGEPNQIKVMLSAYPSSVSSIEHVGLYLDLYGSKRNLADSDAYIIYEKYGVPETFDKNGLFSNTGVTTTTIGSMLEVTFDMTFAKSMNPSDIIIRTWTLDKNTADISIPGAIEVMKNPYTSEIPLVTIPQNNNVTSNLSLENTNPQNSTDAELLSGIKKWGGQSSESISDAELLKSVGINGQHIPSWFMKISKWVVSGDVTTREFVNALQYMSENKMIK